MPPLFLAASLVLIICQIALPRRYAFFPLLIAACHLGNIEIAANLTTCRTLIIIGLLRAIFGGWFVFSFRSALDRTFALFAFLIVFSFLFHTPSPTSTLIGRVGTALNFFGAYLYGRTYISSIDNFKTMLLGLPAILAPLAALMLVENQTRRNYYSYLGSWNEVSMTRESKNRAAGPFRHPILAGSAGATALPFAVLLWMRKERFRAIVTGASGFGITVASSSSGPLAAVAVSFAAFGLWPFRRYVIHLIWIGVLLSIFYWITRGRGPWYIMANLDLVGGSTGRFRADFIQSAINHFHEWWLWGTDYTRHWMPTGVRFDPDHTDLTNYYIHLGVLGGMPLLLTFVAILYFSFRSLYRVLREHNFSNNEVVALTWFSGAVLAAHSISFISISYFDQIYVLLYLLIGSIPVIEEYGFNHEQHDSDSDSLSEADETIGS